MRSCTIHGVLCAIKTFFRHSIACVAVSITRHMSPVQLACTFRSYSGADCAHYSIHISSNYSNERHMCGRKMNDNSPDTHSRKRRQSMMRIYGTICSTLSLSFCSFLVMRWMLLCDGIYRIRLFSSARRLHRPD
jgi:hypothetical protein